MYSFIFVPHISNIYDNNDRKEIEVYRLPIWRDVTDIQRLAYFFCCHLLYIFCFRISFILWQKQKNL